MTDNRCDRTTIKETMKIITNVLERFSKNDLNQNGDKLVFIDTSVLSYLSDKKLFDDNIQRFKSNKWRPVINQFVVLEFLKGLKHDHENFSTHLDNKKISSQLLDKLNSLWVMSHDYILLFEFMNSYRDNQTVAHNFLKIFSHLPLNIYHNKYKITLYPCDQDLNLSYELISYSFEEYFKSLLDEKKELNPIKDTFEEGIRNNVEASKQLQLIKKLCQSCQSIFKDEINKIQIENYLKKYRKNISSEEIESIKNSLTLSNAPIFYCRKCNLFT